MSEDKNVTPFPTPEARSAQAGELGLRCTSCGVSGRPLLRSTTEHGVEVQCRFCGVIIPVPFESAPPESLRPKQACPKCGAPKAKESCPKCGLVYARWPGKPIASTLVREETEKLWQEVRANFLETRKHEVFLAHCLHAGALAYAASQYAEEEHGSHLERSAIAAVRGKQVRAMAEATYLRRPETAQEQSGIARKVAVVVGGLALAVLAVWGSLTMIQSKLPSANAAKPAIYQPTTQR